MGHNTFSSIKEASKILLEIAVFDIQSALMAYAAGTDRLELCESPAEGGITPSYGTLKKVREEVSIPVFPIIRPRSGDFLYTPEEFAVMKKDIVLCKDLGFEGVVTGMLKEDGSIDAQKMNLVVDIAYPMEVTFHRAFDRTKEPLQALEDIIACGCDRILTSGQVPKAFDGKELIKQLVQQADNRIIIMPGSGIRNYNITELAIYTGAEEVHSSARKIAFSRMQFIKESMQEELEMVMVDVEEIRKMKQSLKKAVQ